jgi:predicted enzyme related to lactoylglutathione lyase
MAKRNNTIKSPVITINVEDIDASLDKIVEAGGKVVQKKTAVGDMGHSAYFKDSEGNIMGLWQNK